MTTAVKASLRFIGTCHDLGCTYSVYIQTRQVLLGRCNEVWLHRFRSPPFGSPFHPFPFTHFFSLLFFHVFPCFMSCHLISFLLLRAHCPALSSHMRNLLSSQVSGRPGFYNEVGCHRLFLCTWFLFIATTYILVRSCPLHVFILLSYCAHIHTSALTLVRLASPRGGVCVCVPLIITGIPLDCFSSFEQGDCLPHRSDSPTKRLLWRY